MTASPYRESTLMQHEARTTSGYSAFMGVTGLLLVLPLLLAFAWTGFTASDDGFYVDAATRWLAEFPYVPDQFGLSRTVVSLPISATYLLLGKGEFASVLSTCLFYVALVLTTFHMLVPMVGVNRALVGALLLATTPLVLLKSTIPGADIPNLFFVALSFWLFWYATVRTRDQVRLLVASGVAAGLASLAHESAAALVLFFAILWCLGQGVARTRYVYLVAGFSGIVLTEVSYYWALTGNPLHRLALLGQAAAIHDRAEVPFLGIAQGGTIHIWGPIDPLLMMLTHHDFALVIWLSLPAILWAMRSGPGQSPEILRLARLLLGLAVCWFLVSAVLLGQFILLPRYYMVSTYCLLMIAILWLSQSSRLRGLLATGGVVAIVVLASLLSVAIDNKNPRFAERTLVGILAEGQERIHTDPLTAYNSIWFSRWAGVDHSRIDTAPPGPGALYFWNPRNTASPNRMLGPDDLHAYRPAPNWVSLREFAPAEDFLTRLIGLADPGEHLPEAIRKKIAGRRVGTTLFSLPPAADGPHGVTPDDAH